MKIKKLLAVCAAAMMIGGASAYPYSSSAGYSVTASAAESGVYESLTYEKYDDHVEITGYESQPWGELIIPGEIEGLPVTAIGNEAFEGCDELFSVIIPEGVTDIGEGAFYDCAGLTEVSIPGSVTWIGAAAFLYTEWLERKQSEDPIVVVNDILIDGEECTGSVRIPSGVRLIADNAFVWSDAKEVIISKGVETIGVAAFGLCIDMTYVNIPDSVKTIGDGAFLFCTSLPTITIPKSVDSIGEAAFGYCYEMNKVVILNPFCEIFDAPTTFFSEYEEDEETDDVTFIFNGTIVGYEGSTAQAYAERYGLNFEALSGGALYVDRTDGAITYRRYTDHVEVKKCAASAEGEIVIPETFMDIPVTAVGDSAFSGCGGVTKVKLPESINAIGKEAFRECGALTSVNIPEGVTGIGAGAFGGCGNLKSVTLPDGITTIEAGLFGGCEKLESMTLPENVTLVEEGSFSDCPGLKSVFVLNPECLIYDSADTFNGTIYGYTGSSAQSYAEKYEKTFIALDTDDGLGDVNGDSMVDAVDASEVLAEYARLSSQQESGFDEAQFAAADVNMDGFTDAVDASNILAYYAYMSVTDGTPMPIRAFLAK